MRLVRISLVAVVMAHAACGSRNAGSTATPDAYAKTADAALTEPEAGSPGGDGGAQTHVTLSAPVAPLGVPSTSQVSAGPLGDSPVVNDGLQSFKVPPAAVGMVGVYDNTRSFGWMAVWPAWFDDVGSSDAESSQQVVGPLSTAVALLFGTPGIYTSAPALAQRIVAILRTMPEASAFANALQKYSGSPSPLEQQEVISASRTAQAAAIQALDAAADQLKGLPGKRHKGPLLVDPINDRGVVDFSVTSMSGQESSFLNVSWDLAFDGNNRGLSMLGFVFELDSSKYQSLKAAKLGVDPTLALDNVFLKNDGKPLGTLSLSSDLFVAKAGDIVKFYANKLLASVSKAVGVQQGFAFPPAGEPPRDGLYVAQMYACVLLAPAGYELEFERDRSQISTWPNARKGMDGSCAINLIQAVMDLGSLVSSLVDGSDLITPEFLSGEVAKVMASIGNEMQTQGGLTVEGLVKIAYVVAQDFFREISTKSASQGIKGAASMLVEDLAALVDVPKKIAKVAGLADRLLPAPGYTPLESAVIQVGSPTWQTACVNECTSVVVTKCEGRELRTCAYDDQGCLRWSPPSTCPSGFCSTDGLSCGTCQNQCLVANSVQCNEGQLRVCQADEHGCLTLVGTTTCAEGFCNDDGRTCGRCNHECAKVDATECTGGRIRTCTAGEHGCRIWGSSTACPQGQCAPDGQACGCADECKAGATECSINGARSCTKDLRGCQVWTQYTPCPSGFCADTLTCGTLGTTTRVATGTGTGTATPSATSTGTTSATTWTANATSTNTGTSNTTGTAATTGNGTSSPTATGIATATNTGIGVGTGTISSTVTATGTPTATSTQTQIQTGTVAQPTLDSPGMCGLQTGGTANLTFSVSSLEHIAGFLLDIQASQSCSQGPDGPSLTGYPVELPAQLHTTYAATGLAGAKLYAWSVTAKGSGGYRSNQSENSRFLMCVPRCDGKSCGDDGCGGQCAPGCGAGLTCQGGGCVQLFSWCWDSDGDGFGDARYCQNAATQPGIGWVKDATDCDDTNVGVHDGCVAACAAGNSSCCPLPASIEDGGGCPPGTDWVGPFNGGTCVSRLYCSTVGEVFDCVAGTCAAGYQKVWCPDSDGDGLGDHWQCTRSIAAPGSGWVNNDYDCNDGTAAVTTSCWQICAAGDSSCCLAPTAIENGGGCPEGKHWLGVANGGQCKPLYRCPYATNKFLCEVIACL